MPLITETPYVSPDAFRAYLQLQKRFFENHTKCSLGYEDSGGLQYVGTVKNFGSEMLIETDKMRMNKPPLNDVQLSGEFAYFFQLKYSDFIETYEQQHMIMGCVKPNTMLSNHTYKLKFINTEEVNIMRAEADGDFYTRKSLFVKTIDNPRLIIDDTEIELFVNDIDNTDEHVTYYFALNITTESLIESYADGTLITVDMKTFNELPFIWMCLKDMEKFPSIVWINNLDRNDNPLLTIGTNGQHVIQLYPYIYGENNIPYSDVVGGEWYIKAYGDFYQPAYMKDRNYSVTVTKIEFLQFDSDSTFRTAPIVRHTILWNAEDTKITLVNMEPEWIFHKPVYDDYDYDGTTYINPVYALIPLEYFNQNISTESNPNPACIPAFNVTFSDHYYQDYESEINQMRSGIHVDYSTDYSDNSVIKKYGIAYGLSEFDGLPPYYQYFLDRTIHRPHIELYAIRDEANRKNQKTTEKQTAAIILDAAIPQNDIQEITDDMKPVIVYEYDRTYVTDASEIVSTVNYLSNVVLIDGNHFGDYTIKNYDKYKRFVYHGGRKFSCGLVDYDPALESGRGYLISNDSTAYENNAVSEHPRPARTVARICDIPTSFTQLENITGVSPTIVIDEKYVHQQAPFYNQTFYDLWNDRNPRKVNVVYQGETYILPTWNTLSYLAPSGVVRSQKCEYEFDITHISMADIDQTFTVSIASHGTGYAVNDTFGFNIGGIFLRGIVDSILDDTTDGVDTFHLTCDPNYPEAENINSIQIPIVNFDSRIQTFTTTTTSGTGSGATITFELNESVWDHRISRGNIIDNVYSFIWDPAFASVYIVPFDNIHSQWDYDHRLQLTGDLDVGNPVYDDINTQNERTLHNVFLRNLLSHTIGTNQPINVSDKQITFASERGQFNPPDFIIDQLISDVDLSKHISDMGLNKWNSFLAMVPVRNQNDISTTDFYTLCWSYDNDASDERSHFIFPKRSGMCIDQYDGSWNGLILAGGKLMMYDIMHDTIDTYTNISTYQMHVSSRHATLTDVITLDEQYPEDAYEIRDARELKYNLYRFDHFKQLRRMNQLNLEFQNSHVMSIISKINMRYGTDYIAKHIHNEYEYVEGRPYTQNDLIIDTTTNRLYRALKSFVASSISYDVENDNIDYIGSSCMKSDMINYYLSNYYANSVYDIPDIALYANAGSFIHSENDKYMIGGFVPIIQTPPSSVMVGNLNKPVNPLFVFRIDDAYFDFDHIDEFRMIDESGNDVSEYTLLIINEKIYTFQNQHWEWYYHS